MLLLAVDKLGDATLWQGVLPGWEESLGYRSVDRMFRVEFQVTKAQANAVVDFYRRFSGNDIGGLSEGFKVMGLWMIEHIDPGDFAEVEEEVEEVEDAEESED